MEQLYCGGREGGGGELLLQFLPEKEAEEKEGEEDDVEEEEDEVEECSAVSKAEWSAYMDSYVQVASSGASSSRLKATTSPLLLQRTVRRTRSRAWNKAVILNGLECRAALGSCKLRFVTESEMNLAGSKWRGGTLWLAPTGAGLSGRWPPQTQDQIYLRVSLRAACVP